MDSHANHILSSKCIYIATLALFVGLLSPLVALAGPVEGEPGFYLETGLRSSEPEVVIATLGATGYVSDNVSLKGGFTFFDAKHLDHTLLGMDIGARLNFGNKVAPFMGFGFFYGEAFEYVEARDDNIDNDGDGSVDERGEMASKRLDSMAAVYPELGLHLWVSNNVRITGSGKYFIVSKDEVDNYWIGSIAISIFTY
jgi:hypothetical protein